MRARPIIFKNSVKDRLEIFGNPAPRSPLTLKIIKNRCNFVWEFDVLKSVKRYAAFKKLINSWPSVAFFTNSPISPVIDHPDMYQTRSNKLILICSNYNDLPPHDLGMQRYEDLYLESCPTYIRIFRPGELQWLNYWLNQRLKVNKKIRNLESEFKSIENIISSMPTDLDRYKREN